MADVFREILVTPGVQPVTDFTTASTPHYVTADKIRFVDGFPEFDRDWETIDSFN